MDETEVNGDNNVVNNVSEKKDGIYTVITNDVDSESLAEMADNDGYVKMEGRGHGLEVRDVQYTTVTHNREEKVEYVNMEMDESVSAKQLGSYITAFNITKEAIHSSVKLKELEKQEADDFLQVVWLALKSKATPPLRTPNPRPAARPPLPPREHRMSLPAAFAPSFLHQLSDETPEDQKLTRRRSVQVDRDTPRGRSKSRTLSAGHRPFKETTAFETHTASAELAEDSESDEVYHF